jgi:hypothetical protein
VSNDTAAIKIGYERQVLIGVRRDFVVHGGGLGELVSYIRPRLLDS